MHRCEWAGSDPLYVAYHDHEWGVPEHDDRQLFEKLILDGAQAGLSWITILRKRDNYRQAFDHFDIQTVARYGENKIQELMQNAGIIRNQSKIRSAVTNAQAFIRIQEEYGSFNAFLWDYVDGKPIQNTFEHMGEIPAATPLSERLSKDLKKRGFKFVGPTIVYAYMQAIGMVNDHVMDCFRYESIREMGIN